MRFNRFFWALFAGSVTLPSSVLAGTIVFHSAPVYIAPPVYRSVPTFRAPSYNLGRSYHSAPSLGGATRFPHSYSTRGSELANPWPESAPQLRTHPEIEFPHQQLPPTLNAKNAETDLLNKLQVNPPAVHLIQNAPPSGIQLQQQKAAADQAELQLLNQLHVASPTVAQTDALQLQGKTATATAAEDALLKNLEGPTATQTHSITISAPNEPTGENNSALTKTAVPPSEQGSSVVTIINPDGTHVVNPNAPSIVTTIIPGNKTTAPAVSPTYTFEPTPSGTVQISENGKIIATTTPGLAAQQYGYQVPSPVQAVQATTASGTPAIVGTPNQNLLKPGIQEATSAPAKTTAAPLSSANSIQSTSTQTPTSPDSAGSTTALSLNPSLKNSVALSSTSPETKTSGSPGNNPTQSYNTTVTGFNQNTFNSTTNGPSVNVGVATQSIQGGNNPSYSGSLVQETIHSGSTSASISVGNINGGLTATSGPLSATLGTNVSGSVVQEQLANSGAGLTVSANALSAQAGASASFNAVHPEVTLSLGARANLAQVGVEKQIPVGNYDVNLGGSGGVGLGLGASVNLGVSGVGASGDVGPLNLNFSITPN